MRTTLGLDSNLESNEVCPSCRFSPSIVTVAIGPFSFVSFLTIQSFISTNGILASTFSYALIAAVGLAGVLTTFPFFERPSFHSDLSFAQH